MKKFLISIIIIFFLSIIFIWSIQEDMVFYPWNDIESYNKLKNIDGFEEIKIYNDENLISGWIKHSTKDNAPVLLFFGGNANNSSNACMYFLKNDIFKYFNDYNFVMIDYPKYGYSEGKLSDVTMFVSAEKIYDYVCEQEWANKEHIVIMGYSIGTGVATYLASVRDVDGLILLSPYDKILSLYNNILDIFHGPFKYLAKYKFDSMSYAKNITIKPLIFTSYDDEVIPYQLSVNLSKEFNEIYKITILDNVLHSNYFEQKEVLTEIQHYLEFSN